MTKPVVLLILDGWGYRQDRQANAPALAETPNFDRLWANRPTNLLQASGTHVGLPEGQIGNSEVGHMNIGAGRVVLQTLPRIDAALGAGSFRDLAAFKKTIAKTQAATGRLHLMGLLSPGGVHSHQRHLAQLANAFDSAGLEVILHLFTDGRDTAPAIAGQCYQALLDDLNFPAQIGTISGRYFAMDRDQRWARTDLALQALREGEGRRIYDVAAALAAAPKDEFIEPFVVGDYSGLAPGDGLACVNFRADRVRQLLRGLLIEGSPGYVPLKHSAAMAMAPYCDDLDACMDVLFNKENIKDTLAQTVAAAGLRQFHLAETEKYPHVTFFLNGGREAPWPGEDRTVVPSPKVATYDLAPEMSAQGVSNALNTAVRSGAYDLIICNFANPDMVGHTGDLAAAQLACAAVDRALGSFLQALESVDGTALITADHGNAELMWDQDRGTPHTAHTLNPVPLIHVGPDEGSLDEGCLADLAPTLLNFMGLAQPAAMTGRNLWRT